MKTIRFEHRTEYSFWGNVEYPSNELAKQERDKFAKEMKAQGKNIKKTVLRNQQHKYSGLGQYDRTIGHVYYLWVIH